MDKDNNKRYTTEILADTMNLLGRRSDNPASEGSTPAYGGAQGATSGQQEGYAAPRPAPAPRLAAAPQQQPTVPADDPDDLPF